ncbi:MAG: SufE family protein [Bauldia sp.]
MAIEEIRADFSYLDDWEDRYRYLIELGRRLEPLPDAERTPDNKVSGCASQVWLWTRESDDGQHRLNFVGDSDAHIVKGLIAVVIALYGGKTAEEILAIDPEAVFTELDLAAHLSSQRSNGLRSMVARIKADARRIVASSGAS